MTETKYGFNWGPIQVERATVIRGTHIVRIVTEHHALEVSVSPTGRSVRALLDDVPLVKFGEPS